ncbi:unnamed protein product [Boreogadus saida]
MMESCFNTRREQVEPLGVEDLKKDLSMEFSTLPYCEQDAVVDVKEHLEVYLRIRPFTTAESDSTESQDCVTMESPETVLLKPPRNSFRLSDKSVPQTGQRFHFSKVYGPETSQLDLFDGTVKDLVRHVLEGGNSLVFTYGVTNAGKTFTFLGPDGDAGLLPRSLQLVFRSVEERLSPHMAVKPHRCREFSRLTREQQAEEALAKKTLLKQLKEGEKASASQLCSTSQPPAGRRCVSHRTSRGTLLSKGPKMKRKGQSTRGRQKRWRHRKTVSVEEETQKVSQSVEVETQKDSQSVEVETQKDSQSVELETQKASQSVEVETQKDSQSVEVESQKDSPEPPEDTTSPTGPHGMSQIR